MGTTNVRNLTDRQLAIARLEARQNVTDLTASECAKLLLLRALEGGTSGGDEKPKDRRSRHGRR